MRRRSYLLAVAAGLPLAGCSDDDGAGTATERGDGVKADAFREALEEEGHAVRELSVGERVALTYTPREPTEKGVRESVDDAARAFFDRVYGGWDVAGLDAAVRIDGEVVATWRMERSWIDAYLDGEMTREELAEKVEDSVERRDQS